MTIDLVLSGTRLKMRTDGSQHWGLLAARHAAGGGLLVGSPRSIRPPVVVALRGKDPVGVPAVCFTSHPVA
jgi:hypothetical protein